MNEKMGEYFRTPPEILWRAECYYYEGYENINLKNKENDETRVNIENNKEENISPITGNKKENK